MNSGWEPNGYGETVEVPYPDGVDPSFFTAGARIKVECGFNALPGNGHCWSDDKTYCIVCGHKKVEE